MRLKTKLVVIITGLVFLLVVAISWLHLSHSVQQNVEQNYLSTDIIAHQVTFATRSAVEDGVRSGAIRATDGQRRMDTDIAAVLRNSRALEALLDSVISYSPTVYDISITDNEGVAVLSTNPLLQDRLLPVRQRYSSLRYRSLVRTIGVVTGKPRVYDLPLSLVERNGRSILTVHVGIRTTFLLELFRPWLIESVTYTAISILASLVISVMVASLALQPLEQISRRLDVLSGDRAEQGRREGDDDVLLVSDKIERIGERMRNVQEVFSALQENVDQILSNLQDGLMLFTRDRRAVLVSESVERFLEIDRDHLLGKPAKEIFDRATAVGRLTLDAFERGKSASNVEVETESGRRIVLSVELIGSEQTGAPAGQTLGALVIMHDVESVREIEGELELSRRLSAIGRLTSGVGHEVKNPINAIVVHLELLRNKLSSEEAPAMRHLTVIESEIQRLDRVVQNLVDFSRPVEPSLKEHDFSALVQSVLMLASAELATRNVRVVSKLPLRPVLVKVDADMLRQALLNIVLNGAQAMPQGGALTLDLSEDARLATLNIRDEGEGIAPEVLPRIFDLYFTTKKDGSGIGLAMTYRIVQLHSGLLDVFSELGKGSVFTMRLPLAGGADGRGRGAAASQPKLLRAGETPEVSAR
jgi:signal transduction histidine kinase